jgi:Homeobox KN domain/Mating-type protein beta 1
MNATLRERLIRAGQQFLLAVASNDEETLKVFSQEWSQLAYDIEGAEATKQLDDDTALLLSQVSNAIENIANCMLESGAILQETQTCSLSDFIQDIPSDDPSSIASLHPHAIAPRHLLFSSLYSSKTPSILGQQKFLDSFAYRWLLQNIHNPYPSSVQMGNISDVSGTSTAQVKLWFREARDSIGWNKLSYDFFASSVNATVAAARRVYLERDRNISFNIVFAFTTVRASAEMLFSENPSLQGKSVKMVMDQDHHLGPFSAESGIDSEGTLVPPQANLPAPLDPLFDLSDSDDSGEEDTTPPPSIAGYKRTLAEDLLTSQECDLGRPQKRSRCVIGSLSHSLELK